MCVCWGGGGGGGGGEDIMISQDTSVCWIMPKQAHALSYSY